MIPQKRRQDRFQEYSVVKIILKLYFKNKWECIRKTIWRKVEEITTAERQSQERNCYEYWKT